MTTARMKHGRPHFVSLWMIMMISEVGNQVQYLMLMHQIHEIMHLSREVCRLRFINRYWLGQPRMWPVLSQISLFWSNAAAFEMLKQFLQQFLSIHLLFSFIGGFKTKPVMYPHEKRKVDASHRGTKSFGHDCVPILDRRKLTDDHLICDFSPVCHHNRIAKPQT